MARECKMISPTEKKATVEVQKQRKGWKKKDVVKQKDQRFPKYKRTLYGYFHRCHKFVHKPTDCRIKRKYQGLKRQRNRRSMSKVSKEVLEPTHLYGHDGVLSEAEPHIW